MSHEELLATAKAKVEATKQDHRPQAISAALEALLALCAKLGEHPPEEEEQHS